jgi:pyruvate carboxylase
MRKKIKTQSKFVHVTEYYKNNEIQKTIDMAEVLLIDQYWNQQKQFLAKFDSKFQELDNYEAVCKCTYGDYDYMVSKIVERIEVTK